MVQWLPSARFSTAAAATAASSLGVVVVKCSKPTGASKEPEDKGEEPWQSSSLSSSSSSFQKQDETSQPNKQKQKNGRRVVVGGGTTCCWNRNSRNHVGTPPRWWLVWCLDLPLFLLLFSWAVTQWMHHVYWQYWHVLYPQLLFTDTLRQDHEVTYYLRACDAADLSTNQASDLYLWENDDDDDDDEDDATTTGPTSKNNKDPHYYRRHHLQHGFSVVRNVLSPSTAQELRQYILQRNAEIGKEYFVLENEFRFSFGLDPTTGAETIVAQAVQEVTRSHGPLSQVVEQVVGPNPAVVELTAITSTYGAANQKYHDDIIASTSGLLYARTFDPLWSIFIPLQNTTAAMGATGVCPGMQFCSFGDVRDVCTQHGFSLVHPATGQWTAGDALLMNMNSHHRGGAHMDPHAPERVLFILTLAPQPRPRAESRQISQGITMSLRHDLWGHTWKDLQQADTMMQRPWSTLRSYGLWNRNPSSSSSKQWGYDFISVLFMRIANDPNYFNADTLEEMADYGEGIFAWLPQWLYPRALLTEEEQYDDHAWWHYFRALLQRLRVLHMMLVVAAVVAYISLYTVHGWLLGNPSSQSQSEVSQVAAAPGLLSALVRLLRMVLVVYVCCATARRHLDSTQWARDVRSGRLYTNVMDSETKFADLCQEGWTTLPTRHDVLLEHRIGGSHYLGMFRDLIHHGHYGNVQFQKIIDSFRIQQQQQQQQYGKHKNGSGVIGFARDAVAQHIWDTLRHSEHARFLEQGKQGKWFLMSQKQAMAWIQMALIGQIQYPILGVLSRETLLPMISEWRYGISRSSALASKHAVPVLQSLERRLFSSAAGVKKGQFLAPRPPKGRDDKARLLARPVLVHTFLSEDGTVVVESPSSRVTTSSSRSSTRSTAFQLRFVAMAPLPVSISSPNGFRPQQRRAVNGMPIPVLPTIINEPSPGDWLHTGSYVECEYDDFWYMGRLINVFADSSHQATIVEGVDFFDKDQIRPLDPSLLLHQQVQVRLAKDNHDNADDLSAEEYFFENCRVQNVYVVNNHGDDGDNDNYNTEKILVDLEFDDGFVMDGVDVLLLRREQSSLDQYPARQQRRSAYGDSNY